MILALALALGAPAAPAASPIECVYRVTARNEHALLAMFDKGGEKSASDQALGDDLRQAVSSCAKQFGWDDAKRDLAMRYTLGLFERDDNRAFLAANAITLDMVDSYLEALSEPETDRILAGEMNQEEQLAAGSYLIGKNSKLEAMPTAESEKVGIAFGKALAGTAMSRRAQKEFAQD